MITFPYRSITVLGAVWALGSLASQGQISAAAVSTNAASTNAPAASAPVAFSVGDVVLQAQTAGTQLRQDRTGFNPDLTLQSVETKLGQITSQIDDRILQDAPLVDGNGALSVLQKSQTAWGTLNGLLSSAQQDLTTRVKELDDSIWHLTQQTQTWKTTRAAATTAKAPAETLARIDEVSGMIAENIKMVEADQAQLYAMQNRVALQDQRARAFSDRIDKAVQKARAKILERNLPPLWKGEAIAQPSGGIVEQERISLSAQASALQIYVQDKIGGILTHLFVLGLLMAGAHWLRAKVRTRAEKDASLRPAALVLDVPTATALLLTLVLAFWLYPDAPQLLESAIGAVALLPAVIIIRRLIEPALFPLLYATVFFYAIDQVRFIIRPGGVLSRSLLLLELVAAAMFVLSALRSGRLAARTVDPGLTGKTLRFYLHADFALFLVAGFANWLGYIQLSILVANGTLDSSYFAVVLYAGVRVLDALARASLSVWPLNRLGMVRRHHELLYQNFATTIKWSSMAAWVVAALQVFRFRDLLWQWGRGVLTAQGSWGTLTFSLGGVLAFGLTIWFALLLSRFVRFVLEEEVYPHLALGRGVPYVASTVVHYLILAFGVFFALASAQVDLSKYTILASAFAVGLGFGLQNIMNNFISGLILLFERPIKVGDTIQIDAATMGRVERIGIRASVILLSNGSEMIVPNGNLISNPVTNWTLSQRQRLIEIPFTVGAKADPQQVLALLTDVAKADPRVLKFPEPQALLVNLSAASVAVKVRVWINSEDEWMQVTSDLTLAINTGLAKANLPLA